MPVQKAPEKLNVTAQATTAACLYVEEGRLTEIEGLPKLMGTAAAL